MLDFIVMQMSKGNRKRAIDLLASDKLRYFAHPRPIIVKYAHWDER